MPATTGTDWAALEDQLVRLAEGYSRLAELVDEQRRAIRQADPKALAGVGRRLDAELVSLAELESARRQVCQQLAVQLGAAAAADAAGKSAGAAPKLKLFALCRQAPGRWAGRLRQLAGELANQLERVRQAGCVNLNVARRLSAFCGELLGQVSRIGRETGCYNARGQRALAREAIAAGRFSAVG